MSSDLLLAGILLKVKRFLLLCAIVLPACGADPASAHSAGPGWEYDRLGHPDDITAATQFGILFGGGGTDVDDAFRWMCAKASGGDFLVLRASGDAAYNPYIARLCPAIHSVSTLKITSRAGANDPFVKRAIMEAEAIFLSGGDQANYVNFWKGTPVQSAINARAASGVPIGGTSAGNAVLGEFAFSALRDTITSPQALDNPYDPRVTLEHDFLHLSRFTKAIIMDDHFVTRDRMGRLIAFLARIAQDTKTTAPRAIAIDDKTALLMESDGRSKVIGSGAIYFLTPTRKPDVCQDHAPLTYRDVSIYRIQSGAEFNLKSWTGPSGVASSLSVVEGKLRSTQARGTIY